MNSILKHRARNIREIRDTVHGPSNDVRNLSGEYVSVASNRIVVRVNRFAVNELGVENEDHSRIRYPRFF